MRILFFGIFFFCLLILACGEGNIPTAVDPLVELQATFIIGRPVVDGVLDDTYWQKAFPYLIHIGERDPKTGQIIGGYNVEMKALWWREWSLGAVWGEQPYIAISLTWPDDDKNIDKRMWHFNPMDSTWNRDHNSSDGFTIFWNSQSSITDIWTWDAALTNPVGYMEDQYLEFFDLNDSTRIAQFNIDGLRFLNDISDQNNCWDLNYNDNLTPRDSTDDFPMKIWRDDPRVVLPGLPRIFSEDNERNQYLLSQDAEFMVNAYTAPFALLEKSITVPSYVLEDPLNSSGDIMAAGQWKDGFWTVELVRACKTKDENDVTFNPNERYSNYYFWLFMADQAEIVINTIGSPISLTFEFVDIHQ
ncbi:hypothetical protein JW964_18115 [candidate division KSB1 bacterium]|nr:hypothetical protein [candidate division KSB1 bacterium]